MAKTLEFDPAADRLIGIAAQLVDSHNYIGALKMLNKNADAEKRNAFFPSKYSAAFCRLFSTVIRLLPPYFPLLRSCCGHWEQLICLYSKFK